MSFRRSTTRASDIGMHGGVEHGAPPAPVRPGTLGRCQRPRLLTGRRALERVVMPGCAAHCTANVHAALAHGRVRALVVVVRVGHVLVHGCLLYTSDAADE